MPELKITAAGSGNTTLTISAADGANYTKPASKTVSVDANLWPTDPAEMTPEIIQEILDAHQEENCFDVGDLFPIKFNGEMSNGLTLNNKTYYAAIIGINHNKEIEGNHRLHFKAPYDSNGKQLAWCDSAFNSAKSSGVWFNMNNNNYNAGGYTKCDFKKNVVPLIEAAMEEGWRNIIRACTKYSDTASNVTATQEKIWLLDEFEYHGKRSFANSASQNYQKQYQYYINGNSEVHYKHSDSSTAVNVWCRGVLVGDYNGFCKVNSNGGAGYIAANCSFGVAVGFAVGAAA